MPLYINTNISSLNAQRHLSAAGKVLNSASERLASGLRINSASDDAAGLAISNRLTTQIRGVGQAIRNANDGISLIQTAEGALSESTNNLQRIRELAVQSANGTNSDGDRATLDAEVQQLIAEVDRISGTTSFNNRTLLDGSIGTLDLQVGAQSNQTISVNIPKLNSQTLGMSSTSAQTMGDAMSLGGAGTLSQAINSDDILINGQRIGSLEAGSTVQDLLNNIENNVNGVAASTYAELAATRVGTGELSDTDSLDITITRLDGTDRTLSISNTASLSELAERINTDTGGQLSASINDEGLLVVSGTDIANLSLNDSTGHAAGLGAASLAASTVEQSVVNGLSSFWMREAESLMSSFLGINAPANTEIDLIFANTDGTTLTGDVTGLSAGQQATLLSDGAGNRIAAVWNDPANLKLIVDLADFVTAEGSAPMYNDRIIAHEMVHAVMAAAVPNAVNGALPGWFSEGLAEFLHGADERVTGDIGAVGVGGITAALKTTPGSPTTSEGYSAGYTAVKMLDESISANTAFSGIEAVIDQLELNQSLDTAINALGINWGTGTGLADFETYFGNTADEYINDAQNGTNTYAGVSIGAIAGQMDLTDADTGSVAGSDYGNASLTAASVLPNTASGGSLNFNLTLPAGYTASATSGSARLVLNSTTGSDITISRGQTGRLADLSALGLQSMSDPGIVEGAGITAPATAWGAGDITINNTVIDNTNTDSLAGKLAAINDVTDQTGVSAEAYASATLVMSNFDYTHWSTTNYGDFGINGISITGVGDDTTAEEMATTLNSFSDQTGVSATVFGTDLVLEASRGINLHNVAVTGPTAADAFGSASFGNGQILSASTDATNGTATAVTGTTRVEAGIKLRSQDGSPIALDVGDAAFSATGWKNTNSSAGATSGGAINQLDVTTASNAQKAIGIVDNALEQINDTRSQLGAVSNRLDFTISSLSNVLENSASARARILDADFAMETARLSAAQVMQQAASAMLAQANSRPQQVLSLLQ